MQAIDDEEHEKLVSPVSLWELEIKRAKGGITLETDVVVELRDAGFQELAIAWSHGVAAGALPRIHDDPFDRMLIAQARAEGATLVTTDRVILRYDVPVIAAAA